MRLLSSRVALLRGINVGGNNILPMAELRVDLATLGLTGVRTYIQSGNVVFDATDEFPVDLADRIGGAIEARHGFRPQVLVIEGAALAAADAANPYPDGEPRTVQLYFPMGAPSPDVDRLEQLRAESERYELRDSVFYLHAPDGIGRSKLAAKVDACLGVSTTARNLRTVRKLLSMTAAD